MYRQRLMRMAAGLWWGSLTAIGLVAVPLLFAHLPTRQMAGDMAARLFTAQTWVSLACGALLLVLQRQRKSLQNQTEQWEGAFILIVAGMLLALLAEFGAAAHIRMRENLPLWHSLGVAMYVAQWLCAGALLWRRAI